MRLVKPALLAAAITTAGTYAPAQAASDAQSALALLQRLVTHYAMLAARSFVDLTWEQLTIEPGTNSMIISGLKLYPTLDWDQDGKCEITIDRIMAGDNYSFETVSTGWEISGISIPGACLEPSMAGPMSMFGYDAINIDESPSRFPTRCPTRRPNWSSRPACAMSRTCRCRSNSTISGSTCRSADTADQSRWCSLARPRSPS